MITFFKINSGSDAAKYHDKAFSADGNVRDADNYYLSEQAGAQWQGNGARILGIEGAKVERQDFINHLEGKLLNPATGEIQDLKAGGHENRRLGFDMSIAPPKSVSIMALVGGDDRLIRAHESANGKAMAWLEEHASIIRVKDVKGENYREQTGNLLWATVRHETNRENEPQLHNHNVVMAATYDTLRTKWRSLTNDEVLNLRSGADDVYKASLLQEVKRMGYEVSLSQNGRDFEIAGLLKEHLEAFSGRSKQIDDAIRARGFDPESASWAMRQAAALDTRSAKQELPSGVVQDAWKQRAKDLGLDLDQAVSESRERAATLDIEALTKEESRLATLAVSEAIEHLAEREQVFQVQDIEKMAVQLGRSPIESVKASIQQHVNRDFLIERKGMPPGATWYTTQKAIDSEQQAREIITRGLGAGRTVLSNAGEFSQLLSEFESRKSQELGKNFKLTDEQVNAAKNSLMHSDKFQGIQGDAGTGKTAALEFVLEVTQKKGWQIQGVATTASAAAELEASSGIPSKTIAGFFADRHNAAKDLKMEIDAIRHQIAQGGPLGDREVPRTEIRRLEAKSFDINFGTNQYVFDHQKELVFKRNDNALLTKVGEFLLDAAERHKNEGPALQPGATLGERLKVAASDRAIDLAESLGSSLTRYERVGPVEAHAARHALYREDRDARLDHLTSSLNLKEAQASNLERHGNLQGAPTIYVMDESSMTGANDMHRFLNFVDKHGARGVLQGDIKQHGSVAAGRSFEQLQGGGLNVSELTETRRFDNATEQTKSALSALQTKGYAQAISRLDRIEVDDKELPGVVAERYLGNYKQLLAKGIETPQVAVVAVRNEDRKNANAEIHDLLQVNGLLGSDSYGKSHFDDPQLTAPQKRNVDSMARARVSHLVFNQNYKEIGINTGDVVVVRKLDASLNRVFGVNERTGAEINLNPDKQINFSTYVSEQRMFAVGDKVESKAIIRGVQGEDPFVIRNKTKGVITHISDDGVKVRWAGGQETELSNALMRYVDLGYAHTTVKDQGATYDRMIIAASWKGSMVFNELSTYVASTRAKDNTEIVTSNYAGLLNSAGEKSEKTTAIDVSIKDKPKSGLLKALEESFNHVDKSHDKSSEKTKDQKQDGIHLERSM